MAKKRGLSIHEAAAQVLRAAGVPLTAKEIHSRILKGSLYRFNSSNSLHIVRTQIRRRCLGVQFPSANRTKVFCEASPGRYSVLKKPVRVSATSPSPSVGHALSSIHDLAVLYQEHMRRFREDLAKKLQAFEPDQFEVFAKRILEAFGFEDVKVTDRGRDGGIDGHGHLRVGLGRISAAFQCKRWKKRVGRREISQFRGDIQGKFTQGYFFVTGEFARGAGKHSFQPGAVPIILLDGNRIVELMLEKGLGVEEAQTLRLYRESLDLLFEDTT